MAGMETDTVNSDCGRDRQGADRPPCIFRAILSLEAVCDSWVTEIRLIVTKNGPSRPSGGLSRNCHQAPLECNQLSNPPR